MSMKVRPLKITDLDSPVSDKQLQTHYVYIDNRPISLSCNPGKHLFKLLRETYPNGSLTHSFVYLNFHCDVERVKYDCNLDPAKSEVLFERFDLVSECFTNFLKKLNDGRISMRSPTIQPIEFFPSAQEQSRLLHRHHQVRFLIEMSTLLTSTTFIQAGSCHLERTISDKLDLTNIGVDMFRNFLNHHSKGLQIAPTI
jgi:hypothetical protein